jgi:hypothetical protein
VFLGKDTSLCDGNILTLDAGEPLAEYAWQNGSADPYFTVTSPGKYFVTATNECGTHTDEILITQGLCAMAMPNAPPLFTSKRKYQVLHSG